MPPIEKGSVQVGVVRPPSGTTTAGFSRAAAIAGQGSAALASGADAFSRGLGALFEQNNANADSTYMSETMKSITISTAQKQGVYDNDPELFQTEFGARREVILESARNNLSPRAFAVLETNINSFEATKMAGFLVAKNKSAKLAAHASEIDFQKTVENFAVDQAALTGMRQIGDSLDMVDHQHMQAVVLSKLGGGDEVIAADGTTQTKQLQNQHSRTRTNMVAAGIYKDASDAVVTTGTLAEGQKVSRTFWTIVAMRSCG